MDVGIGSNGFLSFCRGIMNIPPLILILLSLFIAIHCLGACLLASTRKRKHQFKPLGVSFIWCDATLLMFIQNVTQYFQCASPSNVFLLSRSGR